MADLEHAVTTEQDAPSLAPSSALPATESASSSSPSTRLDSLVPSSTSYTPQGIVDGARTPEDAATESSQPVGHVQQAAQDELDTSQQTRVDVGVSDSASTATSIQPANSTSTTRDEYKDGAEPAALTAEDLARQLAGFKVTQTDSQTATTSTPPALPSRATTTESPSAPHPQSAPEEAPEEEWLLKEIHWPPLPPTPASFHGDDATLARAPRPAFTLDPNLKVKIICQNENGPCSLIALCNILILRNDLHLPRGRDSVTYSYLSNLLADYFLSQQPAAPPPSSYSSLEEKVSPPQLSLSAVLSILPQTRYGLNLNPRFDRIDGFSSSSTIATTDGGVSAAPSTSGSGGGGELALFSLARIPLLHGWLADPSYGSETYDALQQCRDYDTAMEAIVQGAEVAGGIQKLRANPQGEQEEDEAEMLKEVERRSRWTEEEERKVQRAHLLHAFLESTSTQLTYPGLAALCQSPSLLPPSGLAALFRNSHLSVLYRRPTLPPPPTTSSSSQPDPEPELFTLVTDSSLSHEGDMVWESLGDVDGGGSEFFDARLRRSARTRGGGGDWVVSEGGGGRRSRGRGIEEADRREVAASTGVGEHNEINDLALAQQLQAEEDAYTSAQLERAERREQQQQREPPARPASDARSPPTTSATSPLSEDLRAREKEHRRLAKDKKGGGGGKGKDEKCLLM
ncbi:hypothetical protein JCM10908_005616 [Rhodotorula pacifica]|uniref:MINDY family deubiquitinase n=1 Tax=Rhodotorula pacifica TaxID=1495444 RepID=UPI00317AD2F3